MALNAEQGDASQRQAYIRQLQTNPAWNEIERRIKKLLEGTEHAIEHPDPFAHGKAVGERRAFRIALTLPAIMLQEIEQGK